ncbi:MAG TPA: hypothetical protein VF006_25035 [Longimicrobium sp.]
MMRAALLLEALAETRSVAELAARAAEEAGSSVADPGAVSARVRQQMQQLYTARGVEAA